MMQRAPFARPLTRGNERNRLLLALPTAEYARLAPDLESVTLASGAILMQPPGPITHVYFPQRCVVSVLTVVTGEPGVEIAIIGNEGMVGLPIYLGVRHSATRAISQVPDGAHRLTVSAFRRALVGGRVLPKLMQRYTVAFVDAVAHGAACHQRHSVPERCARWLLMAHDRVGRDRFALTQEFLAQMLGVERPTVSTAARRLREAGAIAYSRGRITILNRGALERAACSCYRGMRDELAQTMRG